MNEIPGGTRHSYLEKVAYVEVAKLNGIPAGSRHAYLEEVAYAEEAKLNEITAAVGMYI